MKVLLVSEILLGGAEIILKDLACFLKEKKVEITILTFANPNPKIIDDLKSKNISIMVCPSKNIIKSVKFLSLYLNANQYDIIHSHLERAQLCLALVNKIFGGSLPLVTTEHVGSQFVDYKYRIFLELTRSWIYKQHKKIVCASRDMKTILSKKYHKHKDKFVAICNGTSLEKFFFEKARPGNKPLQVICLARLHPQKDLATCIRAFALLQTEMQLTIVGEGRLRKSLIKLISKLGLQQRVRLLGECYSSIPELLQSSDIYVQPSRWEAISVAVLEAMASGLPVIVSDAKGLVEAVGESGLIFPVGDEYCLAELLERLAKDYSLRLDLAKKACLRACDFSVSVMGEKYYSLYQSILVSQQPFLQFQRDGSKLF